MTPEPNAVCQARISAVESRFTCAQCERAAQDGVTVSVAVLAGPVNAASIEVTFCQWCAALALADATGFKVVEQIAAWHTAKNSRPVVPSGEWARRIDRMREEVTDQ